MSKQTTKTVFTDNFSKEIYEQTYKYGNETIDDTHERVAKDLAKIEKDSEYWKEKFLWALRDFKFVPGGRITSNAGTNLKGTSYINCVVSGPEGENQDSMEGIMDELRRQAMILKSEQGYGICANFMRPRGAFIHGIGNTSPGAVKMLEMWDTQSSVITEGSGKKSNNKKSKQKIRKGAQMVTMSCWHPDVLEFITIKQTPGKLTKFNMSVLVTDSFMNAVKSNGPWNLEYPDYESYPNEYNDYWDGDLDAWKNCGYKTNVYYSYENANELWDIIMTSTYNRNEPGVLFIDTMNKLNNLYYCEHINATNPCLTGDTNILTNKGNYKISELIGKEFTAIVDSKEYKSTPEGFWSNGEKEVYELEMANGIKIKATDNHKFYTDNGWKEVKNIKENIDNIQLSENSLSYTKVKSITYAGVEEVFDCTIPEVHKFSANGIISHNCGYKLLAMKSSHL